MIGTNRQAGRNCHAGGMQTDWRKADRLVASRQGSAGRQTVGKQTGIGRMTNCWQADRDRQEDKLLASRQGSAG